MTPKPRFSSLNFILPGILTAMTGVGVGDLATAGFTGAQLGVTVLWAVLLGAFLKFVLSEGLTRWQIATGTSVLHGGIIHLRKPFILFMFFYFFPWCYFVGGALINASGVAAAAICHDYFGWETGKMIPGIIHSLLAVGIILLGHYKLFSRIMSACAALLFMAIFYSVFQVTLDWSAIFSGIFVPRIPQLFSGGIGWTVALMGGVGGTLTIVCYGYWILEHGRRSASDITLCRWDLAISYFLTALFGMAMVIIGSAATGEGKGLGLILNIAAYFRNHAGVTASRIFLLGAWSAIFSSLLGVWQAVPLIFTDAVFALQHKNTDLVGLSKTGLYRIGLLVLATVPMLSLFTSFKEIQKIYSIVGALFMPLLALLLFYLNTIVLKKHPLRNSRISTTILVACVVFFLGLGIMQIWQKLQ